MCVCVCVCVCVYVRACLSVLVHNTGHKIDFFLRTVKMKSRDRSSGHDSKESQPRTSSIVSATTVDASTSSCPSSSGSPSAVPLWKACLRKLENFRRSQKSKISMSGLFYLLNERGTNVLPKREFVDNLLSLVQNIKR